MAMSFQTRESVIEAVNSGPAPAYSTSMTKCDGLDNVCRNKQAMIRICSETAMPILRHGELIGAVIRKNREEASTSEEPKVSIRPIKSLRGGTNVSQHRWKEKMLQVLLR